MRTRIGYDRIMLMFRLLSVSALTNISQWATNSFTPMRLEKRSGFGWLDSQGRIGADGKGLLDGLRKTHARGVGILETERTQ
jgi:hypothetical protein